MVRDARRKQLSKLIYPVLISLSWFPTILHASFIESSMGAAVVNDATASYYNPAALILLKGPQIIALGSIARFNTRFSGSSTQVATDFTQTGSTRSQTNYYLPSFYMGMPVTSRAVIGLAVISNFFNRNIEDGSVLRYVQSNNSIQDVNLVPALGYKFNDRFSAGVGLTISYADFVLRPNTGFPTLNIPDSQSRNQSDGTGVGADAGFLLKLSQATVVGFNYRSAVTYRLSGKSVYQSSPQVVSNRYHFDLWTPARATLSVNHFVTPALGFIGTLQRIQWSIMDEVHIYGIATRVGNQPDIVNAVIPYHLHDAWLVTLGSHYRLSPAWVVRVAGSYNQSPGNGDYQLSNGDSLILGLSTGYDFNKYVTIDGSYAHAFIQNARININNARSIVKGVNEASRDGVAIKLTFNV